MKKITIIPVLYFLSASAIAQVPYPGAPAAPADISQIEFYADKDPGFGLGTPITGFTPSTNINGYNGTANIGVLPMGFHRFYIRSKNADGNWSLTNNNFFDNYSVPVYGNAPAAPADINYLEYFIDNNVNFGNGTPISITPGVDIAGLNTNINITGLVAGIHRLYIRSRDADGKYSLTNIRIFDNSISSPYPSAPAPPPPISNMEYFVDSDPGFGNATPITVPTNTGDINNFDVNINLSGSLSAGLHYLYIRSKQNPWSLTNAVTFTVGPILPLTWSYVKAQMVNEDAKISWQTFQELNTASFDVEHSTDGRNFKKLASVAASGSNNGVNNYPYLHIQPPVGINYYRIRQVDIDGHFSYSVVVTVLQKNQLTQTLIAPNPVNDILNIIEPRQRFIASAEIYNTSGKLLLKKEIEAEVEVFSMPVQKFAAGIYLLKLNYKTSSQTLRFVKY